MVALCIRVTFVCTGVNIIMQAIEAVRGDRGYTLPSQRAMDAAKCVDTVIEWVFKNKETEVFVNFCDNLVTKLKQCLPSITVKLTKQHRAKMWRELFQLQTSSNFNEAWAEFLKLIHAEVNTLFYEHVTDEAVKILIREQFRSPVSSKEVEYSVEKLTYEENNALRYAAGVIPRKLMTKIKNSTRSNKNYLLMYLEELLVEDPDEDISADGSTDWINLVDRGGLLHVNELMFKMMQHMEVEFRHHLDSENIKASAISGICNNDEVLFYWELLSGMCEKEERDFLLKLIVELWVTIRGFAYASGWMEEHKQVNKKMVQKSKGVRKN